MTDKLRDAEREAFEAWWNDPASADNSKVYEVTPTAEIRRLCQDIAERAWQARAALAQQDVQAVPQEWVMTEAFIDEFIEDYEMLGESEDGRDACYTPSDGERALIKDAVMGLIAEAQMANAAPTPPAQRVMLTDEDIREWWVSENGLEDCDMTKLHDFTKVVRAVIEAYERKNGLATLAALKPKEES